MKPSLREPESFLYYWETQPWTYLILSVLSESEAEFTVNMTIKRRGWLIMFHHGARNVSQFLCLPGGQS